MSLASAPSCCCEIPNPPRRRTRLEAAAVEADAQVGKAPQETVRVFLGPIEGVDHAPAAQVCARARGGRVGGNRALVARQSCLDEHAFAHPPLDNNKRTLVSLENFNKGLDGVAQVQKHGQPRLLSQAKVSRKPLLLRFGVAKMEPASKSGDEHALMQAAARIRPSCARPFASSTCAAPVVVEPAFPDGDDLATGFAFHCQAFELREVVFRALGVRLKLAAARGVHSHRGVQAGV